MQKKLMIYKESIYFVIYNLVIMNKNIKLLKKTSQLDTHKVINSILNYLNKKELINLIQHNILILQIKNISNTINQIIKIINLIKKHYIKMVKKKMEFLILINIKDMNLLMKNKNTILILTIFFHFIKICMNNMEFLTQDLEISYHKIF